MSSEPLPDTITTPNGNHILRHEVVRLGQFLSAETIVAEIATQLIAKGDADIAAKTNIAALEHLQTYGNTTLVVICTGNTGKTQEITLWVKNNIPEPRFIHQDKDAESGAGNQPYGKGVWKGASGRIADSASRFDRTLLSQHKVGTVLFVAIEDGIDQCLLSRIEDDNDTSPQEGPATYAVAVCYNAKDKSITVRNSNGVTLNQELLDRAKNGGFEDPTKKERGIVTYGKAAENEYGVPRQNWHPDFCGSAVFDRYKYFHRSMMDKLAVPFVNKS